MGLTLLNLRGSGVNEEAAERTGMVVLDLAEARAAESRRQSGAVTLRAAEVLGPSISGLGGDVEDARFRRITSPNLRRDLNPLMQQRMQQICFYLSVTAPFAKRFIELMTSYTVGAKGFRIVAKEPAVQEVIDRFSKDPINHLQKSSKEWSDELAKFGEICITAAVNEVDGSVRLGYIDPQEIEGVEYGRMTMSNGLTEISTPVAVHLRQRVGESEGSRRLTIVQRDEDVNSPTFGRLSGDCFYRPINKAKTGTRGISDLYCLADWIDVLDQIVFDGADRVRFLNSFLLHYVIQGADQKKVDEWTKYLRENPVKQGGIKVTNETVTINPVVPDFKASEFGDVISNLKSYGLGGMGFPNHWFADPGDVNLATAKEMGEPTLKKLEDRQAEIVDFVTSIVEFVLDKAQEHGVLAEEIDREFDIQTPELSKKDLTKSASIIQSVTGSISIAEDRGWIRGETAAKAFYQALGEMGIEVDAVNEYDLAQKEIEDKKARGIDLLNPQSELAGALRRLDPGANPPSAATPVAPAAGVVQ